MTEGYTSRMLRGLAELLAARGLALWSPVDPYPDGTVGVFLRKLPQSPDGAVVLAAYPIGADDPDLTDTLTGINVRVRGAVGDPDGADDLADAIYEVLHGAERLDLAGITAALVWRQSTTTLGPDSAMGEDQARRWDRSDNYRVQAARLTPHRTD